MEAKINHGDIHMNINKIALSIMIVACSTTVFATDLRSIQLDDYNCEESSEIEVKACLETTLSRGISNLNETEHYFNKAVDDVQLTPEESNELKIAFKDEKETYAIYSQKQCNLKVSIEGKQDVNANLERLSLICQINAIDHRIESLTEFTNDLVNDFVASNSPVAVSSDTPLIPYISVKQDRTTEYINEADPTIQEVTETTEVIEPTNEEFTQSVETTDEVSENDMENDI